MRRWLLRLLIVGLILFVAFRVASRMLGGEEDFDDYDDIEAGLDFTETPVEIDVPATEASPASAPPPTSASADRVRAPHTSESGSVIDVNGIGPTYPA